MSEAFCVIEVVVDDRGDAADYLYRDANAAFARHMRVHDVEGRLASELFPHLERTWLDAMRRVWETGEPEDLMDHVAEIDGWFEVSLTRVGPREARQLTCLLRDVTARKLEQDEREANARRLRELADQLTESDRRKTEFLASLAHELRNPLAPIRNGLELIGGGTLPADQMDSLLAMMTRQLDHVVRLVDDLLDVARISQGTIVLRPEMAALADVLAPAIETARPLMEEAGHTFEVELPPDPVPLCVDPVRIAQTVLNLLDNAARYTSPGGRVRLAASAVPDDEGTGSHVVIGVSDDGDGLERGSLRRVFEMFTRNESRAPRRDGGLGVGLPLAERLARLHGGTLVAHSDGPGTGSRFELRLPIETDPDRCGPDDERPFDARSFDGNLADLEEPRETAASGSRGVHRVLVVDDNADAADTLAKVLRLRGYEATTAHGGRAAVAGVREARPDVVFLDLGMPDMTGYEVAAELDRQGTRAGLVLIALTGWGSAADRARTAAAGFDHHLTKPVSAAKVLGLLAKLEVPGDR